MRIIFIGMTLFALFFGAGNLIFPVSIGQLSGDHFQLASLGFIVTGVFLPLLGVIAMGYSGEKDFLKIAQRCGIIFGLVFATTLYLTIGPLFAMPRTASISYEIAIKPFVQPEFDTLSLGLFTTFFYVTCCLLSLNPHKFISIVGKVLTPMKISFVLILILAALISPMGKILPAVTPNYQNDPFFTGFTYGYLTMDTLASLIFGIIVVQSVINYGIKDKTQITFSCFKASLIAGAILTFLYTSLVYMGATSVEKLGVLNNGGEILARVSQYYFGEWGNVLLGLMVTVACMTTNIGLTHACANYLVSLCPKFSYRVYVILFSLMAGFFANIGLSTLISFSEPVLSIIYPVTIVLIGLTFAHRLLGRNYKLPYMLAIYCTLLMSILFEIAKLVKIIQNPPANLELLINFIKYLDATLVKFLPLYKNGIGWLIPALVVFILGVILSYIFTSDKQSSK